MKLSILADSERFFLPQSLSILASKGLINRIYLHEPPGTLAQSFQSLSRYIRMFGLIEFGLIGICHVATYIMDLAYKQRFYSIAKVARRYNISIERISDIHSTQFIKLIGLRKEVIFCQVSKRLKPDLLKQTQFWNKHSGLLPRYKGVFPIFWAMLKNETKLGVTIHIMDESFDTGPILAQKSFLRKKLSFFEAYGVAYRITTELICELCLSTPETHSQNTKKINHDYYSYPSTQERKTFLQSNRFGLPISNS